MILVDSIEYWRCRLEERKKIIAQAEKLCNVTTHENIEEFNIGEIRNSQRTPELKQASNNNAKFHTRKNLCKKTTDKDENTLISDNSTELWCCDL